MSRSTKQDTVVKYALLRGKLVPRSEALAAVNKAKAKVTEVKVDEASDKTDAETAETKAKTAEVKDDNVSDKTDVETAKTAPKPKNTRKTTARKPTKAATVDDDDISGFEIDAGDVNADTKTT